MQLIRLSLAGCALLAASHAEEYVSVQYLYYDEQNGRVKVSSPALEVNVDYGYDDTLNLTASYDAVSGASPNYFDASSGASPNGGHQPIEDDLGRGNVAAQDVGFENRKFFERRNAFGARLTHRFDSRDELRIGANYSLEFDLYNYEGSLEYMHYLDGLKNRAVTLGVSYQRHINLVPCGPFSSGCDGTTGSSRQIPSNHFNVQGSFEQVIDPVSRANVTLFYAGEVGYLTNSYKNIVRDYATAPVVINERRPETRHGGGIALGYSRALGDSALHVGYRYYTDDWHLSSHTPELQLHLPLTDPLRLDLGLRYYHQDGAYFYSGSRDHFTDEYFASSDDRLATFDAYEPSVGMLYQVSDDVRLNADVSWYEQSTGLQVIYGITGIRFDF